MGWWRFCQDYYPYIHCGDVIHATGGTARLHLGKNRSTAVSSLLAKTGMLKQQQSGQKDLDLAKKLQIYLACTWCALVFTPWRSQLNN